MNDPSNDSQDRKLARAYIAVVMARDATNRWINQNAEYKPLQGLLTTLDVTARLLEEILEEAMPAEGAITPPENSCSELIM